MDACRKCGTLTPRLSRISIGDDPWLLCRPCVIAHGEGVIVPLLATLNATLDYVRGRLRHGQRNVHDGKPHTLKGRKRVVARRACVLALRAAGFSFPAIGAVLRINHATAVRLIQGPTPGVFPGCPAADETQCDRVSLPEVSAAGPVFDQKEWTVTP